MAKTLTKKELNSPDQFQSIAGSAAKWAEENVRFILAAIIAVVVAAFAWIGYGYFQSVQETKAEKAIYPAQTAALKMISETKDPNAIRLNEYLEVLKAHSGQKASASSAIQMVAALAPIENTESLQKQIIEAVQFYPATDHVLFGLWNLTEGQVLTRNGELAGAKDAFQNVLSASEQKEFHPTALIQLGALAEKEGDLQGAKDFYSRVTREFPDSEAREIAEKLLIHVDLLGAGATQGS